MNIEIKETIQDDHFVFKVKDEIIQIEENFTHESGIYDKASVEVKNEDSWDIKKIYEAGKTGLCDNVDTVDMKASKNTEEHNFTRIDEKNIKTISSFTTIKKDAGTVNFDVEMEDVNFMSTETNCNMSDFVITQQFSPKSRLKSDVDDPLSYLKKYKCHLCDYASKQKYSLREHINAIHLNLRNHKCRLCEYVTNQKYSLKIHIDSVHLNLKKYKCDFCHHASNQKSGLKYHIETVHLNLRKHKCHLCDYITHRKDSLKTHINTVHLNLRNHKCHLCDYITNRKDSLKTHIDSVHLKLRNHKCDLCDYVTNRKYRLKIHIDSVHLNLRNHKCELCDYVTNRKYRLKTHIDTVH